MKKKLYVGNLSLETTESELQELFGRRVPLRPSASSRIVKRPPQTVWLCGNTDGGDESIAVMNGKKFNGRVLTLNEARPMFSRDEWVPNDTNLELNASMRIRICQP